MSEQDERRQGAVHEPDAETGGENSPAADGPVNRPPGANQPSTQGGEGRQETGEQDVTGQPGGTARVEAVPTPGEAAGHSVPGVQATGAQPGNAVPGQPDGEVDTRRG